MRWVEVHTSRYSQVLMQIVNFDNLTFLTALVVFNQSNEWNDTYRVIIVNIVLSSLSISSSCWYRSLCFGWIRVSMFNFVNAKRYLHNFIICVKKRFEFFESLSFFPLSQFFPFFFGCPVLPPFFYEFLLLMLVYLFLFFFFFTHVLVYFLPPREEDAYEMTIRAFLPFLVLARE